jgi:hypothetical protein
MKTLIILLCLSCLCPVWAGAGDKFTEKELRLMQEHKGENIFLSDPKPIATPKKGHWEVKVLQEGKLNDFLKDNPEWEPFSVCNKIVKVEYNRRGDDKNYIANLRDEERTFVYLKRWVEE